MATVAAVTIPITIYGLGVRDYTLTGMLFLMFGIAQERALSMTLYWFVIALLFPSIIGALITLYETKKMGAKKQRSTS